MSSDPKTPDKPTGIGIVSRLRPLTAALQSLYAQVATRLLLGRMGTAEQHKTGRDALPIADLINDRIDDSAPATDTAEENLSRDEPALPSSPMGLSPGIRSLVSRRMLPDMFNGLKQRLTQLRGSEPLEPFMRERMRKNALDHVNKALILARRGQAEGARLHAELAENAMRTAGEYMSDEEYRQFREELEARLHPRDGD